MYSWTWEKFNWADLTGSVLSCANKKTHTHAHRHGGSGPMRRTIRLSYKGTLTFYYTYRLAMWMSRPRFSFTYKAHYRIHRQSKAIAIAMARLRSWLNLTNVLLSDDKMHTELKWVAGVWRCLTNPFAVCNYFYIKSVELQVYSAFY